MMNDAEFEEFGKHILKVCKTLNEHCDSVRIFVTAPGVDGNTHSISKGSGNWYAQYGHVKEWITSEEEATRMEEHNGRDGAGV